MSSIVLERRLNQNVPTLIPDLVNSSTVVTPNELQRYRDYQLQDSDYGSDVLQFWKTHHNEFPLLEKLVRNILAIMPSSVSSRCSMMNSENVDHILFINSQHRSTK